MSVEVTNFTECVKKICGIKLTPISYQSELFFIDNIEEVEVYADSHMLRREIGDIAPVCASLGSIGHKQIQ